MPNSASPRLSEAETALASCASVSPNIHSTVSRTRSVKNGIDRYGCEIIAEQVDFLAKAKEASKEEPKKRRYLERRHRQICATLNGPGGCFRRGHSAVHDLQAKWSMRTAEMAAGVLLGLEANDGYLVPNPEFFRNGVSVFDGMKVPLECRSLAQTSWKT